MDVLSVATSARDEALKRAVDGLTELIAEAEDATVGKDSLRRFSEHAARLRTLLQELHFIRYNPESLSTLLHSLDSHVRKASAVIKSYKSRSRLHLLLNSSPMLDQLRNSAREMAGAVQLLGLANLDTALDLKPRVEHIFRGLESMEFKSAASAEAVAAELEKSISQNGRTREYTMKLLQQIAEAVGADPDRSLVKSEIALLKLEKAELEEQKQHAEAFQLSQLMQLLYSTEMVSAGPSDESLIDSFTCPLSRQLMEDPVAVMCGHSFERKAIAEHFGRGERRCPTCKEELPSLQLTLNISLCNSIQEWKRRAAQSAVQNALSRMASEDPDVLNQALEDVCDAMQTHDCIDQISKQQGLIPRVVELLKSDAVNTKTALKCLCYLARYSDENKEAIAREGAVRAIVKLFCKGQTEPEAVEVLLELSQNEALAELIGSTTDSIVS